MDIYDAIMNRRSVRSFKPDPIPQDALDRILEACRCAPSSMNLQPWKFIFVSDIDAKRKLTQCCPGQSFAQDAPNIIVGCALPTRGTIAGYASSNLSDVAVAFAYLSLAAAAEGLGTCWITAFDHVAIAKLLEVPETIQVSLISPLGYPTDKTLRPKHRKPISEIISWNKYS